MWAYSLRNAIHDVACRAFERVRPDSLQQPPQIAIGDDAGEAQSAPAVRREHRRHAQLLARHLVDHLRHQCGWRDLRERLAAVHQVAYTRQSPAQAASRVQIGKVAWLEAGAAAQFQRNRISQRQHDCGRGRGGKVQRARFLGDADVQRNHRNRGQCRRHAAGKADDRQAHTGQGRE